MRIGYARVSTRDQDTAAQLAALDAARCERLFEEKASGGRWDRPELQSLLGELRSDDVVVVWKLDCLSRSLKDLILVLEKIDQAGAHFQSLTEAIDTATPAGPKMMHMVSSIAKFERSLLKERTQAGLEEARKAGRVGGRRPKLTDRQKKEVIALVTSGKKSGAEAARLFRVHPATVSRLMARHHAAELDKAPKPPAPAKRKKAATKKTRSKKRSPRKAKKTPAKPIESTLDAIGLTRPDTFKDFPGAVSVLTEAKTTPIMNRMEWKTSPRKLMAVWEAEELIREFRQSHADANITQRYKLEDKTIIELMAAYDDEQPDHRIVLQARNR